MMTDPMFVIYTLLGVVIMGVLLFMIDRYGRKEKEREYNHLREDRDHEITQRQYVMARRQQEMMAREREYMHNNREIPEELIEQAKEHQIGFR